MSDTSKIVWEEVKPNFWSLKEAKVGDFKEGVYVDRRLQDNRLKAGTKQAIYTLIEDSGEAVYIGGRSGNPQVIAGLESATLGERVRIRFAKIIPSTKPGFNDTKILAVDRDKNRTIFKDVLDKYRSKGQVEFEADELQVPPLN